MYPRSLGSSAIVQLTCWLVVSALTGLSGGAEPEGNETNNAAIENESIIADDELRSREREFLRAASAYYREGQFGKALEATQRLAAVRKRLLGDKHPSYAACLNNLGELYRLQARYREAEAAFKEETRILRATSDEGRLQYALTLNNQGLLYIEMAEYEAAESLLGEAIALLKMVRGEDDAEYALALNNQGLLYRMTGDTGRGVAFP